MDGQDVVIIHEADFADALQKLPAGKEPVEIA